MNVCFMVVGITLVAIIAMVVIFVFIWKAVRKNEDKRSNVVRQFAAQTGYQFFADNNNILNLQRLQKFSVFRLGNMRKAKNIMRVRRNSGDWTIFDYHIRTGHSGRYTSAHYYNLAVFLVRHDKNIPNFLMYKENFLSKLSTALGFNDINFDTHPTFSQRYVLKSDDPNIRGAFSHQLLSYFERYDFNFAIQSVGNEIIFYRMNRLAPYEINQKLQVFEGILDLLG